MQKTFISLNGKKIFIGYKLLELIAKELPPDHAYEELAKALFDLHIPSICEALISHECITMEQLDDLWDTDDIIIQRVLIKEDSFFYHLTDEQARGLMEKNDKEMLLALAKNFHKIVPSSMYLDDDDDDDDYDFDDDEGSDRISEDSVKELENFLANHEDIDIKITYANYEYLQDFKPTIDELIDYTCRTKILFPTDYISLKDLSTLANAPVQVLIQLGSEIEEIKDEAILMGVANIIANHPDPAVRLAVAENEFAPDTVLKKFLKDKDIDVKNAAYNSLYEYLDDDDDY